MKNSHWFRRLEIALEFDSGFEIFLLLGRGELARPALERIAEKLRRFGAPRWHRLHLEGLDGLLVEGQPEGVLHLVHGFERMPASAAADMAARLNVNRDRLEVLRGPVIFWVAEDFYEELLRQAPDFVAWRSQASVVPDADLGISSEIVAEQFLLCETHRATAGALCEVPPLDVLDAGVRKPLLEWLAEGDVRSLCFDPRDAPLRVISWCAGELARRHDIGDYDKVPVLLPSLLATLAERTETDDGLAGGIARLWEANALDVVVAAVVTDDERDFMVSCADGNRALFVVLDEDSKCVPLARLSEQQAQDVVERSLSGLGPRERRSWQEAMATVERVEDTLGHFGLLAATVRYSHHLALQLSHEFALPGQAEHDFEAAVLGYLELPQFVSSISLRFRLDVLARLNKSELALCLYQFGARVSGEARERSLLSSISMFRAEAGPKVHVEFVQALIAFTRVAELGSKEEALPAWAEAVALARELEPRSPELLVTALGGLGKAQYAAGRDDEAEQTLREGLSLATVPEQHSLLGRLRATLGDLLLDQERYEEAFTVAESGLAELDGVTTNDLDGLREDLLAICDNACSGMGMADLALGFATRRLELRRARSPKLWLDLTLFAQRLFDLGKLDRALSIVNEAIASLSGEDDELPYHGYTDPLTVLAEIQRALDDRDSAVATMRESVRVHREVVANRGTWWASAGLAEALLSLASDLEQLDDAEAFGHLLEAVDILEQVEWFPGEYPIALARALSQLGDYAAAKTMYELATAAYARVLVLAAPFPARMSEPVLAIERRLDEVCRQSGITLDDALVRGRERVVK